MSKLDAILASHSMLNLTTTKTKRAVKDLMISVVAEVTVNQPLTYEKLKQKIEAL